jgi:tight adherence protein C
MIHVSTATAIGCLSALAALATGASVRYRLVASPRHFQNAEARSVADDPVGTSALSAHSKDRLRRLLTRARTSVIALTIPVGVVAVGPLPALLLVASWLSIGRAMPLIRRRQLRRALERELPGTVDLLVLSIHAGLTPDQAVREVAVAAHDTTRPAFAEVVRRMDRGEPLANALSALPRYLGPSAAGLAEVVGSASRYGTPLSQVLEQLSGEARSSRRRLDEAAARRLPVQLSFPLVICTLPSFVLLTIAPAVIAALSSLGASAG